MRFKDLIPNCPGKRLRGSMANVRRRLQLRCSGTLVATGHRGGDMSISTDSVLEDSNGQIQYANLGAVQGRGLELEVEEKWSSGFEGRAAYTLQMSKSEQTGHILSNSPKHLAKMNLIAPLAQRRLFAGFEGLYSGSRVTLARTNLDGSFLANLCLVSQRVFKGVDISVGAYNLFNTRYADPGAEEHRQLSIQQDGRNWRLKLTYGFGGGR